MNKLQAHLQNHSIHQKILFIFKMMYSFILLIGVVAMFELIKDRDYLAAGLIVILVILSIFLSRITFKVVTQFIIEPVEHLIEVADKITNGDFKIENVYESEDEFGHLSKDFQRTGYVLETIVNDLHQMTEALAKGNFAIHSQCPESYVGELQGVLEHLDNMSHQISASMDNIQSASRDVAEGSNQLAISAQDIAEGATNQAATIQELVASVESITEQIQANTESTDAVHDKAKVVGEEAIKSQTYMEKLMDAMERINENTQNIEKVIVEIENIAAQTNLLSLNASIEAARAGEAGRGFAVVAEQIRQLAEQSASAAVTSKKMIEEAVSEVDMGNQITHQTNDAMNSVIGELDEIIMEVAKIRTASDQQSVTIEEIRNGFEEINDVIQNNSAAAEETSATSQELSATVEELNRQIEQFVIREM